MASSIPRARRVIAVVSLGALASLVFLGPAAASDERCGPACVRAQRSEKNKDEGLLDKVGLGSLEDVPWATFPLALGLSALIGLAGGFVYSGLTGPPSRTKKGPD